MKNKVLLILVILIAIVSSLYISLKKPTNLNNTPDTAYVYKTNEIDSYLGPTNLKSYKVDLNTKEVIESKNPKDLVLSEFTGLPDKIINEKIITNIFPIVFSPDQVQVIISVTQLDREAKPSGFDGSLPVQKSEQYICDTENKKCSKTDILENMIKAGYDWTWIYAWNFNKDFIFTHPSGEGIGSSGPVIIYNYKNDILKITGTKIEGYSDLNLRVPNGSFSPSAEKFIVFDYTEKNNSKIKLYNIDNFTSPKKEIFLNDIGKDFNSVDSVAWSPDEDVLAIVSNNKIYTLDLNTEKVSLKYEDKTGGKSGMYLSRFNIKYSQSGRYIYFVDYIDQADILKAIDLKNNNIVEILSDKFISL